MRPIKNFEKYSMAHQYMPKIFYGPHKNPPAPPPTYLMYGPLFIILSRHNCHSFISNGFELLCNVCYWRVLLIVFLVSLRHQVLISCDEKCYFPKLGYQLVLVQCFWKKTENHKFSNFFSFFNSCYLKCRTFFRMAH